MIMLQCTGFHLETFPRGGGGAQQAIGSGLSISFALTITSSCSKF